MYLCILPVFRVSRIKKLAIITRISLYLHIGNCNKIAIFGEAMGRKLTTKHPNIKVDSVSGIYYISQQINKIEIRPSLRTKNFNEAKARYTEVISNYEVNKKHSSIRLFSAVQKFIDDCHEVQQLDVSTMKSRNSRLKKLMNFFENVDLNEIDDRDYKLYLKNEISKGNAKVSRNNDIIEHKTFFNWCCKNPSIKRPYLKENPLDSINLYSIERQSKKAQPSEHVEEFLKFVKTRHADLYAVSKLIFVTGLRISEVLKASFNDLDFEGKTLLIKKTKGKNERTIELNHSALSVLKNCREMPKEFYYKINFTREKLIDNSANRLFPHLTQDGITDRMQSYNEKFKKSTGVSEDIKFHVLRHSFASKALEMGIPIDVISKMLGHKAISTTMIYLNIQDKRVRKASSLMNVDA
jgi:integrase/recombinase XerD